MSILFDSVKSVERAQEAFNGFIAAAKPLKVDGKKGTKTKAAVKSLKRGAAKTSKARDLAIGFGGLTVGGVVAALQGFSGLWVEHGSGLSSGTPEGLAAALVPFLLGLFKLAQQAFPEWF